MHVQPLPCTCVWRGDRCILCTENVSLVTSNGLRLWHGDIMSPFPPSGNKGYIRNRDVPFLSFTSSYVMTALGVHGKRHNLNPVALQMLASYSVLDKWYAKIVTFPMPQRKFTVLGTRRDQKGEYIAAGVSHAAVPEHRIFFWEKGFRPFWKVHPDFPAGGNKWDKTLWRPDFSNREVTCGDSAMDWPRGQYYIWNGSLRQVLPGSREERHNGSVKT